MEHVESYNLAPLLVRVGELEAAGRILAITIKDCVDPAQITDADKKAMSKFGVSL